jgi:hypothetical protein
MSFVLKNVCPDLIIKNFKLLEKKNKKPNNRTSLYTIMNKPNVIISFLDKAKKKRDCMLIMINSNKIVDTSFKYHCYWCRYPIEHFPICIPIDFVYNTKIKSYYSKRNNENYVIHEKTLKNELDNISKNISLQKNSYYITDGIVCSWNCGVSYINSKKNDKYYIYSKELLYKMYKECNNIPQEKVINIKPSPHWQMIDVFGGNMTINMFRSKFNKYEYINHGKILLDTVNMGHLFEEYASFN